jgi:hypothetical protein
MPRPPDFPYLDLKDIQPRGKCQRGGEIRPRRELKKEYVWAGDKLAWNGFFVCDEHRDPPHPQDKPLVLKPDPVPVEYPLPDIDVMLIRTILQYPDGGFMLAPDGSYILGTEPLQPRPRQESEIQE